MEFSNMSPFHGEEASPLNDQIKKVDLTFDHFIRISKWDNDLKEASQQFLAPYHLLSLIKATIGTKEQGASATELTFGSADADYTNSYQKNWIRDEHIERFYGMKFGPKSLLNQADYTSGEIEKALQHHLSIILPNQPQAQIKYFNYFKSNYVVDPPLSPSELTDMQLLWNIIHQSLELAFKVWISDLLEALADYIRTFKVVDPNKWRHKLADGTENKNYAPYLPIDSIEKFASGILFAFKDFSEKTIGFIESIEQVTEDGLFFVHTIVLTIKKLFVGINKFVHFLLSLLEQFIDVLRHINAFLIGVYNGIIEFIAGIFDLLAFFTGLLKTENRTAFVDGVDQFYEKYQKEGLWSIIKEILDTFIQKYKDAPDSCDIAKYLGEDIIQIVIEILIAAATGGTSAVKRLGQILKDIKSGVFRSQLIGTLKVIDDVLKGNVKLDEYIDEFGNIKKRKKGDFTRYANFAEMVAHEAVLAMKKYRGKPAKFKLINEVPTGLDDKIKRGIDAIYENELFDGNPPPPKYLINEVKANTTNNPLFNALSKLGITKYGGKQMSKRWIQRNLDNFDIDLRDDIMTYGYDPVITGVNMDGTINNMSLIDNTANEVMKI